MVWIATVCGKLKTDFRYSNTLGWNTFPVPTLTEQNKADLTHCAEDILLAREHYFPATIADMYAPDRMDSEFPLIREAHDRNDEVLESASTSVAASKTTPIASKNSSSYIPK